MAIVLSIINAFIFTIISGFHFYWAMGGKVGFDVVLPSNTEGAKALMPSKIMTIAVAFVFLGIAIFYLIQTGYSEQLGPLIQFVFVVCLNLEPDHFLRPYSPMLITKKCLHVISWADWWAEYLNFLRGLVFVS